MAEGSQVSFAAVASERATLKVAPRTDFGSRESRRLRRQGLVPGIVYAAGSEARPFQVPERDVAHVLAEGHALFDLEIEGAGSVPVVVKEQQLDAVRGTLKHIDCLEVKLDEAIEADVALELLGAEDAPGVKTGGGVLEHVTREVTIMALPTEIPDAIYADVSGMEINDTLQLSSVSPPEGVSFVAEDLDEVTVATLSPPRVEEAAPELEEEAELVGEEGEAPEAGAEDGGEGAAEGETESGGEGE
ncbi:MAG: large subunit ribosomal protein [Solirubrobacterales bacterium]|jgi:large subunit ribosomal protein L25|nr:large subunit ribosomal protein [Solirubrobacterales bacterium]MDX6651337.1 large subunit ribosomal protein [Solirubrobacterales bacterium]MDX6662533.1 large subunit ribosomal protein [Solirubrobacterales bacterium]